MNRAHGAALDFQRGAAGLFATGGNAGAHGGQRVDDALHGAGAQRGIAEHAAAERQGSQYAGHETHAGAAVTAVNIAGRGGGLHAGAGQGEILLAVAGRYLGPQLLHGAQGVDAVLTAEVVANQHGAGAQCAQNGYAVGDALISRYGDGAAQSLRSP